MDSKKFTLLMIYLSIGTIYLTAGLSKLAPENIGNLIGPVDAHQIFNSTTGIIFMDIVAVLQIIIGALLLSLRFSFLGLIAAIPLSLGILVFTIVTGFEFTPIINLILLMLLIYAGIQEKVPVSKILKNHYKSFKSAVSYQEFPKARYSKIALSLVALSAIFFFLHNFVLNILVSLAFIFFTINIFQRKDFLTLDKILIVFFLIISTAVVNALLFKNIGGKILLFIFLLIPLGVLIYIIRLIYWKFSSKKSITQQDF